MPLLDAIKQGNRRRRRGGRSGGDRRSDRGRVKTYDCLVSHAVWLARARVNIEGADFSTVERTCAAAPEHSELISGFIDTPVAVNTFRNGKSRPAGVRCGNEFWCGPRAETRKMRWVVPRGDDLQHAKAVLAISHEGISTGRDHSDFYVVHIVELAFGGEQLIEPWRVRLFNVNNGETLLPS